MRSTSCLYLLAWKFHIINKASTRIAVGVLKPRILGQTGRHPRGAGGSTSTPKPRVESSNLSAPAKKTPEIVRFQVFFLSIETIRGLAVSPCRRAERQFVQCVTRFCNRSVWYSIKRASRRNTVSRCTVLFLRIKSSFLTGSL